MKQVACFSDILCSDGERLCSVRAHVCGCVARRCGTAGKQGNLIAPVFVGELKKVVFYCVFEDVKWWRRLD
jgi:hypothetical protein